MEALLEIGKLIAWVETKGNFEAFRFEPAVYARRVDLAGNVRHDPATEEILTRIARIHACSLHTALMVYASSWGATQLMGFNLYGHCAYARSVAHYLANETDQDACFASFLLHAGLHDVTPEMLAKDQFLRLKFSMRYNGSIVYETPLIAALKHFGLVVV
jgi:hypothetical protein